MWQIEKTSIMVDYIAPTKRWVSEFVIKNHICPFARKPFEEERIEWLVLEISEQFLSELKKEIGDFVMTEKKTDTKFLIIPELLTFDATVEIFYLMQELATELDLETDVEFVSFHPESKYGDTREEEAVNFANRSPFPMIQLLRKSDLEALELTDDDKADILDRNKTFLDSTGYDKLLEGLNEFRKEN